MACNIPDGPTASRVAGTLWIGSAPPVGADLSHWHTVVLTASEYQPSSRRLGARVIHAPMDDARLTHEQLAVALAASDAVAELLLRGRPVLVTCWLGRNRSSLVAGLAMRSAYGLGGGEVVELIRDARGPEALSNPHFVRAILSA